MIRKMLLAVLLSPLAGCDVLDLLEEDEKACDFHKAFWPDADGDGVGDEGTIYLGCEAPEGYTQVPPGFGSDTDVSDTDVSDTDADTDTSDTDAQDTDTRDTDAQDTDGADTDAAGGGLPLALTFR